MKKGSVKKNYLYNLTYQIITMLTPLLTTPYLARVLGPIETGKYSYTNSIVSIFAIFAYLGFGVYGQRAIAKYQNDVRKQTIEFWNVFLARLVPAFIALILYTALIYSNVIDIRYLTILKIQYINIIAVVFDITYYYQGNEDFGSIVFRNIIIKTLNIFLIFLTVRTNDDLIIYVLIQSGMLLVSDLPLWPNALKALCKIRVAELSPFHTIRPAFILFLPTIATTFYTSLDKTLIGLITKSDFQNGNYEYADRLIRLSLTLITSLGTVLIPRNSQRFVSGDIEGVKKSIYTVSKFAITISLPMCVGMILISPNLVPWFLGNNYTPCIKLIQLLSPIIIFIGLSNILGHQYLIPSERDNKYTISIIIGTVSNLLLNVVFIKIYGCYGAAISTAIAELIIVLTMGCFVRKELNWREFFDELWKCGIGTCVMALIVFPLVKVLNSSEISTIVITLSGTITYFVVLLCLKHSLVIRVLSTIKRRIL